MDTHRRSEDVEAARHIRALLRMQEDRWQGDVRATCTLPPNQSVHSIDESRYFLPGDLFSAEPLVEPQAGRVQQQVKDCAAGLENDFLEEGGDGSLAPDGTRRERQWPPRKVSQNKIPSSDAGHSLNLLDEGTEETDPSWGPTSADVTQTASSSNGGAGGMALERASSADEDAVLAMSKWHSSALVAGSVSEDGHIFARTHAGPRKSHSNGMTLSSLCMLFERSLRVGGVHTYRYSILEGCVGAADGVGFVFDSRIRRTNIQRMRSIFLNKHGQVCIRNFDSITKLPGSLPKLSAGTVVHMTVDLDAAAARFKMQDVNGTPCGTAELSFASLLPSILTLGLHHASGFFCAIVTGSITVSLH
mmetsp:Transcript_25530/g.59445  ORF Transcript_25530/g.59445 Transcript_25530/m.59445 type:complete len:361 (+) Transcript_25530:111-1193(+)|eukprot:CAMPEP_0178389428 /NCGR_PEP_ID=MMETSP0689_2-20121128/10111_1 /TAXON_ID=160604 /ORGANISM="Amphidinium massartii, Strain CS-259" /LENGTH=360 /DNA_ID=CAMNT_0020009877 /DNA_START=42 /DNA_END=1124 /DNA_ORIENTATION=+